MLCVSAHFFAFNYHPLPLGTFTFILLLHIRGELMGLDDVMS